MEFGKQRDQFRIFMQTPVENPLMTIERFNRQFQIGEKEREAVKWGWEQKMGNTMFHVVNAYRQSLHMLSIILPPMTPENYLPPPFQCR